MNHRPLSDVAPTRSAQIRTMRVKASGHPKKCPFSGCGAANAVTVRYSDTKHRMEAFCKACGEVLPSWDGGPAL